MTMGQLTQEDILTYEPAHPDRLVGAVATVSREAIDRAVDTAVEAQRAWGKEAAVRVQALHGWANAIERDGDTLVDLMVREVGKPVREARAEFIRGIAILRYYAQMALEPIGESFPISGDAARLEVERRPLGTALLITPWNFPVAIPIWKMAPALAYGNTVVFRPSSSAALTAQRLIQLGHASVPSDVLHLIPSRVDEVDRLLGDSRIAGVSFTGSAVIGRRMIERVAGRNGAVQAEMGGQNASIVLADADLEEAADIIADASMGYAGQKCTATSRVIVEQAVADDFLPMLVDRVRSLTVGDPSSEETRVGPVINEAACVGVSQAVDEAVSRGAELLTGGRRKEAAGWYYEPTLVALVDPLDPFAQEETFGPAASVLVADNSRTAIEWANATQYGLSAAVFGSVDRATAVANELNAGLVRVNAPTTGVEYYAPFGGDAASSYGPREQGKAAREFYTRTRTLVVRPPGWTSG